MYSNRLTTKQHCDLELLLAEAFNILRASPEREDDHSVVAAMHT